MSTTIYKGIWTNWSHGRIQGATLTLSARNGGLLTAFLAVFVTIISVQFWRFFCYVLHQIRSTYGKDKTFDEYQVILRNAASPGTGVWAFIKLGVKGSGRRSNLLRAVPWVVVSTLYLAAFALAAIFSSNISKSPGDARLINSTTCGIWLLSENDTEAQTANWSSKQANETFTAANYARQCYIDTPNSDQCTRMPVPMIPYKTNNNASCPFESGLCVYGDTAALNMTSDLINSYQHLGINQPPQDRISYQFTKTCAPINNTGRVSQYIATSDDQSGPTGDWLFEYQLGSAVEYSGVARYANTTYVYNNHTTYTHAGYIVSSFYAQASQSLNDSEWDPIPELNRTDADISIIFIEASNMIFEASNNDPLFGAHIPGSNSFIADKWVTTMACAEQIRICNPINDICSPFLGYLQLLEFLKFEYHSLLISPQQTATILRIQSAAESTMIQAQVDRRMGAALRATETANGRIQAALPDTQWMIETTSWFGTALARFQLATLEYATGPSNPEFAQNYKIQNYSGLTELCLAQIIHDASSTTSFSILGLVVLLSFGGLAIVLNQLGEHVLGYVQKVTGRGLSKRDRWIADDLMNLHSVVLQRDRLIDSHPTTPFRHTYLDVYGKPVIYTKVGNQD